MKELEWEKQSEDYNESKPLYLKCDCGTEGVDLQYFRYEGNDKGMYLNFWQHSIHSRYNLSLWDKIRYCWKIFRRGTLHGDMICLSLSDSEKLAEYIHDFLIYDKIRDATDDKEEKQEEFKYS
jgi:hypothetical protein